MEALREMRCVACRSDAPTVTEAEIAELLPQVSEWEIVEQEGIKKLSRVFRFDDFAKALAFTTGRLVDEGARMVFVNGALNSLSVPSVAVDEVFAGERATQHLLELEHTRIGYVAGPDFYLPTQEKAAGRERALRAAGLERGLGVWSAGCCGGCFGRERQDRRV